MSSKKTAKYNFHLWESSDKVLHNEFNDNTQRTEKALVDLQSYTDQEIRSVRDHADASVAALQDRTDKKAAEISEASQKLFQDINAFKPNISFGSYVGNGSLTPINVVLGCRAKSLLVFTQAGKTNEGGYVYGGLASRGYPVVSTDSGTDNEVVIELLDDSFAAYGNGKEKHSAANVNGMIYHYLVIF